MAEPLTSDNIKDPLLIPTGTPGPEDWLIFRDTEEADLQQSFKKTTTKAIIQANLDDTEPAADKLYSSQKVESYVNGKLDTDIKPLIPAQATADNQLADKDFVNSTVGTNTAIFRGTFNSVADLEAYSGDKTNNDYAFVIGSDSAGNTLYNRYKYNGTAWVYEYSLNNSSFTAEQWAAINSGITDGLVEQIGTNLIDDTTASTSKVYSSSKVNALLTAFKQAAFNAAHPVGEYYVQYPTIVDVNNKSRATKDPNTLYNVGGIQSTWTELNFSGSFFRANGGFAKTFGGGVQSEGLPNITANFPASTHDTFRFAQGAISKGDLEYGTNFVAGGNGGADRYYLNASWSNSIYGASSHVTPTNFTVKVWIRTA